MDLFCKLAARGAASKYIRTCFPPREKNSHKGSFGRAWLACGSPLYTGAALLAAEGCLRMGAGLTYLAAPPEVTHAARVRLPELICREMPRITQEPVAYAPLFEEADAILIGPGIGGEGDALAFSDMVFALLSTPGAPLVLDADALNLIARAGARDILRGVRRAAVVTPHPMEFARLTGQDVAAVQADRAGSACRFATETGVTVLLKGAGSIVARPDGVFATVESGSPALAKGGTGDVLAGMLTALLAQGLPPADAAFCAAYLHGKAGEAPAAVYGERGVLPSALAAAAARALNKITRTLL